jgi:hypothetical protein
MTDADPNPLETAADGFDCQTCGACCVEAGAVILAEEDDVPGALVQHVANLRCMVTEGTSFRCAALLGTVGLSVGCAIYRRRPEVCRSFDAGSDECLSARDAMRLKRATPGRGAPGARPPGGPPPAAGLRRAGDARRRPAPVRERVAGSVRPSPTPSISAPVADRPRRARIAQRGAASP